MNNNDEHFEKQFSPIEIKEFGTVKDLRFVHPAKHRSENFATVSDISNDPISLFKRDSSPSTIWKLFDMPIMFYFSIFNKF
jgi:hypothetical protein